MSSQQNLIYRPYDRHRYNNQTLTRFCLYVTLLCSVSQTIYPQAIYVDQNTQIEQSSSLIMWKFKTYIVLYIIYILYAQQRILSDKLLLILGLLILPKWIIFGLLLLMINRNFGFGRDKLAFILSVIVLVVFACSFIKSCMMTLHFFMSLPLKLISKIFS